jgi:hypothetical protein
MSVDQAAGKPDRLSDELIRDGVIAICVTNEDAGALSRIRQASPRLREC